MNEFFDTPKKGSAGAKPPKNITPFVFREARYWLNRGEARACGRCPSDRGCIIWSFTNEKHKDALKQSGEDNHEKHEKHKMGQKDPSEEEITMKKQMMVHSAIFKYHE